MKHLLLLLTSTLLMPMIFVVVTKPTQAAGRMTCMYTTISSIHPAVSGSWAGHGKMDFSDGRYAVLFMNQPSYDTSSSFLMRQGDRVKICISNEPTKCPSNQGHRTMTVRDLNRPVEFESINNGIAMAFPCEMPPRPPKIRSRFTWVLKNV